MPDSVPQTKWVRGLLGMNQRQNRDEIPDNYASFLVNISNNKPGSWSKRKGSVILGAALSSSDGTKPVKGMVPYDKNEGTNVLYAIRDGKLWSYNDNTDAWSTVFLAAANTADDISMVNFKNRLYWIGANTVLKYTDGSTMTDVGGSSDQVCAEFLAVAQNTLYVGGVTKTGGSPANLQNRVYYSLFRNPKEGTDPNQPSHQLWENEEYSGGSKTTGTLALSSRFFETNGPIKAMLSYDAINNVVAFTKNRCYSFDLSYASNALGPKTRFNVGIAGKKAWTICNDWLVWMDQKGRIQGWGGAAKPSPISWEIEDEENQESILNSINKSNLSSVAAGAIGNKFYFSVGNVTHRGILYSNVLIKGMVTADFSMIIWGIDTLPYRVTHFTNAIVDGEEVLIMGSSNNNVYQYGIGTNDNGVAIDARAYTKFYDFDLPNHTKMSKKLLIKYRPQSGSNCYLTLRYATDQGLSYTALSTPDAGTPVTKHGVIDMNKYYSLGKYDVIDSVDPPQEAQGRSISYEISNSQLNEDFEISQYGIDYSVQKLNKRVQ